MIFTGRILCDFLNKSKEKHEYVGDLNLQIKGFCSLNKIKENCITWVKSEEKLEEAYNLLPHNCLIVTGIRKKPEKLTNYILCDDPKRVFFSILIHFFRDEQEAKIEEDAVIQTTDVGKNVSIGHGCYIGESVKISDNVRIENNVSIECPAIIGSNSIIHSGVVIGTDGFGYYKEKAAYEKVPHFGGVVIGRNVEIGANTCIDRGTLDDTCIEDGVKIDNLCHIAHNVQIGENSLVIALSLLGGSSKLEKNTYIAPGVMVKNQVRVGANSLVGMGSVVIHDVETNKVVVGSPAKVIRDNI